MSGNPAISGKSGKPSVKLAGVVERIVSGGQTGADRAALDFARAHGIPYAGWCPRGRLAEDGPITDAYALRETPTPYYVERTRWNVRDSDGTVIFSLSPALTGGSKATADFARALGKPWLHLSERAQRHEAARLLRDFITRHGIRVLNVAGPRASGEPNVGRFVESVLTSLLEEGGRA